MSAPLVLFLVSLLGSDDFRTREGAEAVLTLACYCSEAAYDHLPPTAADPEVRHRLENVADACRWRAAIRTEKRLLGEWRFEGGSEAANGAAYIFLQGGRVDYRSSRGARTVQMNYSVGTHHVYISYFGELYQQQEDGSYLLESSRYLRLTRP